MEDHKDLRVQKFKEGHPLHPAGCVVVTDQTGTKEYTLEAWQELQQSPPSE